MHLEVFLRGSPTSFLGAALVSSSPTVWTTSLLCWFLALQFICIFLCLIRSTLPARLHPKPWVTPLIKQGCTGGNSKIVLGRTVPDTNIQTQKKLRTVITHIPAATWKLIFPQWYIFRLISTVNYVPAAIFMVFWMYWLHFWIFFGSSLYNQITSQGSNLTRADWRKILWGENGSIEGWFSSIILSLSWIKYFVLAGLRVLITHCTFEIKITAGYMKV